MLNACFRAAIKVLKISWQLISDSIQHSSLFCLKMLNKAVKNGFPCKTFFKWNEEQQIHTMNEWSDRKLLILNTHTFHSMTSYGSLITLSQECQRETLAYFCFCAEREESALWQCISAWKNIQMTLAISQRQCNTT